MRGHVARCKRSMPFDASNGLWPPPLLLLLLCRRFFFLIRQRWGIVYYFARSLGFQLIPRLLELRKKRGRPVRIETKEARMGPGARKERKKNSRVEVLPLLCRSIASSPHRNQTGGAHALLCGTNTKDVTQNSQRFSGQQKQKETSGLCTM